MNSLGNAVRGAVLAAAVFVLPVVAVVAPAASPATGSTDAPVMHNAGPGCCTGTPWGEMGEVVPPPIDA